MPITNSFECHSIRDCRYQSNQTANQSLQMILSTVDYKYHDDDDDDDDDNDDFN